MISYEEATGVSGEKEQDGTPCTVRFVEGQLFVYEGEREEIKAA